MREIVHLLHQVRRGKARSQNNTQLLGQPIGTPGLDTFGQSAGHFVVAPLDAENTTDGAGRNQSTLHDFLADEVDGVIAGRADKQTAFGVAETDLEDDFHERHGFSGA